MVKIEDLGSFDELVEAVEKGEDTSVRYVYMQLNVMFVKGYNNQHY